MPPVVDIITTRAKALGGILRLYLALSPASRTVRLHTCTAVCIDCIAAYAKRQVLRTGFALLRMTSLKLRILIYLQNLGVGIRSVGLPSF